MGRRDRRARQGILGVRSGVHPGPIQPPSGRGDAVGIPEVQLRKAASSAVCKINIDSDGRLAMTAVIRKVFAENPAEFDPRKYLGPAREELIQMVKYKNEKVLGSAGKA